MIEGKGGKNKTSRFTLMCLPQQGHKQNRRLLEANKLRFCVSQQSYHLILTENTFYTLKQQSDLTYMSLKPMCCIHYGQSSRHITLIFDTHPPQHLLPVSFDTVARELPPRTPFHRFARWKGDAVYNTNANSLKGSKRDSALFPKHNSPFSLHPPPLKPATV